MTKNELLEIENFIGKVVMYANSQPDFNAAIDEITNELKTSIITKLKKELEHKFELMYEDGMKLSFIESEINDDICIALDEHKISDDDAFELRKYLIELLYTM